VLFVWNCAAFACTSQSFLPWGGAVQSVLFKAEPSTRERGTLYVVIQQYAGSDLTRAFDTAELTSPYVLKNQKSNHFEAENTL
jgi:hypothetical protein